MLVHIKKIVPAAQKRGYAVGAFNTANLEITLGIVQGAVARKAPVIIQVSETTINYAGLEAIVGIIKNVANHRGREIPIALHLDHGKSLKIVKDCIEAGFSSIHIDASEESFEKNIAITKKAVDYAHRRKVWAQAELGSIFGKEGKTEVKVPKNPDRYMTNPKKVKEFVRRTRIDTLAISVGTMHGMFQGREKIDFPRLTEISRETKVPLVLHGASGIKNSQLTKAVSQGIIIVNIDTALRIAFTGALRKALEEPKSFSCRQSKSFILVKRSTVYDPRKKLQPAIKAVQRKVEEKINALGSAGRK